uniref:F-box domain-containing protein n=1 Tax=Graphocephala atropunctata TaxID=36148 RepID=A0A1B6LHG5_9HEMI
MKNYNNIQSFLSEMLTKISSNVNEKDLCNNTPFLVGKNWKNISIHSILLKNYSFEGKAVSSRDICFMLHNAPQLKSVNLVLVDDVVPVLREICRSNSNIEKLTMKKCSSQGNLIPETVLINVLLSLRNLQSLELKQTKFTSHKFFETISLQSNITSIDVSLNEHVTLGDLMMVAHNSRILEFKMSRRYKTPKISDQEMAHLIKALKQQITLLHMDMCGLGNYTYNEIFSCSNLNDLKLNNAINLGVELLCKMSECLRNIRNLKIEGPSTIGEGDLYKALFADPTFGHQLETLKLEYYSSLSDKECCEILEVCPNLKKLSLKGSSKVTIEGICDVLVNATGLTLLNLAFLGISTFSSNILKLPSLDVSRCCC